MRVKFHGYDFGDRILEDVYFQADIIDGVVSNVAPDNPNCRYWDGLNHAKWLKEAKEFLEKVLQSHGSVQALEGDGYVEILP
jgi:hypothetical protein